MNPLLSHRVLDALRTIGDPYLAPADVNAAYARVANDVGHQAIRDDFPDLLRTTFINPDRYDEFDTGKLEQACNLFELYGSEIGAALLLAALPEAYSASTGSRILYQLSQLASDAPGFLTRRIAGTAQFLLNVMVAPVCTVVPDPMGMASPALQIARGLWGLDEPVGHSVEVGRHLGRALTATLSLRLRHEALRRVADERDFRASNQPEERVLNQEDLLGTLLTFSVTVFEVLEQFGITWAGDDQEAYLYAWDLVGHYLGIGDQTVVAALDEVVGDDPSLEAARVRGTLRPQSVLEARALVARIRERVWSPGGNPTFVANQPFGQRLDDVTPGRVLLRALLEDLRAAMPPGKQLWPLRVMRQLAPATVQDRLALGAAPTRDSMMSYMPGRRATIAKFTHVERPNRMNSWYVRGMATDVVDRYFGQLIKGGLAIPGLAFGRTGDVRAGAESRPDRRRARAAPPAGT